MPAFGSQLSAAEIRAVAEFVLTLVGIAPPGDLTGEELYVASCSACHGIDGRARSNIRGEKPDKIVKKVLRGVGRVMPSFADTLSRAEIDRIADYVSGLDKSGGGRNGN
jgi:mono/diheme cytochrome c family protein